MVIPELHNKNAVDPLRPKVDLTTIENIKRFLQSRISPFVSLHVTNPVYEAVRFEFCVQFKQTCDAGYYFNELQRNLKRLLCPWMENEGEIHFEGVLHGSQAITYIEKLSYVDHIEDFLTSQEILRQDIEKASKGIDEIITKGKMAHQRQGDEAFFYRMKMAAASSPLYILVSAHEHCIKSI